MAEMKHTHCAVVGAGTVGACCAWHLRRAGFEVTLIDPEPPGQSTSFGNAGCITPSHVMPFSYPGVIREIPGWLFDEQGPLKIRWAHLPGLLPWFWKFWRCGTPAGVEQAAAAQTQLMRHASADFAEILEATDSNHLWVSKGVISVHDSRDDFNRCEWEYDLKTRYGWEWQILSPAELKIMVPALRLEGGVAVFNPGWEHTLDPGRLTERIAEDCFAAGGNWLQDRVTRVEAEPSGVRLTTAGGKRIRAGALVVAAGVWSNRLCRQLDGTVPLTPKRGYHAMIGDPGVELDYPVNSASRFFVMTPMRDGLRVAGKAEFTALDAAPDYRLSRRLLEQARHYLPDLKGDQVTEWMGQRPMTPDNAPIIARSPRHRHVFYAFGHGHYGLTQGPTTGRIITDLVRGRDTGFDLEPYRFDRF
jgi:D-amino-acid dehydrogenase